MKNVMKIFATIFCIFSVSLLWQTIMVQADTADKDSAINYLEISGPDYVYAFEGEVSYTLKLNDFCQEQNREAESTQRNVEIPVYALTSDEYSGWKFKWKSDNAKVAKFQETLDFLPDNSCYREAYPTLERPNIFSVHKGTTTITCRVTDYEGNSVILKKQLTVLDGTPICSVKVGRYKIKKFQKYTTEAYIYSNSKKKKVKVKVIAKKNWKVQEISVDTNRNGYYKDITQKKTFSLKAQNDVYLQIKLLNEKTEQEFQYQISIERYKKHKIKLGKLKDGCSLICRRTAWEVNLVPQYTVLLKYKKNSKKSDSYTFNSGKDLAKKMKKYWGYSNQTLKYQKGVLTYKETWDNTEWIYCTDKSELKEAKKKLDID